MSTKAEELRARLIRNFNEVPLSRETREPLYDGQGARLALGTAALKLSGRACREPSRGCGG